MRVHRVNHPAHFCRALARGVHRRKAAIFWEKKMALVMAAAFIAGTFFGCLVMGLLSGNGHPQREAKR